MNRLDQETSNKTRRPWWNERLASTTGPWRKRALLAIAAASVAVSGEYLQKVFAQNAPSSPPLYYAGSLEEDGSPVTGSRAVRIQLWDAETNGKLICDTEDANAAVEAGRFRVALGNDCADALQAQASSQAVWLALSVDGTWLGARTRVGHVPYALHAERASQAAGALAQSLTSGKELLAWEAPVQSTLSDTTTDLGAQLAPLVARYRSIEVTLAEGRTFTWNQRINLAPFQRLRITGEGFQNGAANLTTTIRMTENRTVSEPGYESARESSRVVVGDSAHFGLVGVRLEERANDPREATPHPEGQALFSIIEGTGTIDLSQIRISTTEHVVNIGGRAYGRVLFGWTFIEQAPASVRPILAVAANPGYGFAGNGGVVSRSYTSLGPNVSFEDTPRIVYLE